MVISESAKDVHGWISPHCLSAHLRLSVSSGMNTSPDVTLERHHPHSPERHFDGALMPARSMATSIGSLALQSQVYSLGPCLTVSLNTLSLQS